MDSIISIRPEFVERIVDGRKSIEIRTRRPRFCKGDRLWVYEKLPVGHISVRVTVVDVLTLSPVAAWRKHRVAMGVSSCEFWNYVGGRLEIALIRLGDVKVMKSPVSLADIRRSTAAFHPPQFFSRIECGRLARRLGNGL